MSVEGILQEMIIRLERLERRIDDLEPIEANQNIIGFAAPTTLVDLAANPGVLNTALRSDAGLALDQAIAPTWTGLHAFQRADVCAAFRQTGVAGNIEPILLRQDDTTDGFFRVRGDAAVGNITRNIVDEGDQGGQTREGWFMFYVRDDGAQVTNAKYFVPFYSLS